MINELLKELDPAITQELVKAITTLHAVLLQMEFAGKIQQRPGKIFARA